MTVYQHAVYAETARQTEIHGSKQLYLLPGQKYSRPCGEYSAKTVKMLRSVILHLSDWRSCKMKKGRRRSVQ